MSGPRGFDMGQVELVFQVTICDSDRWARATVPAETAAWLAMAFLFRCNRVVSVRIGLIIR